MNWTAFWIGLGSSGVGSLGFALIFRVRGRHLPPASLGGMLAFAVYFLLDALGAHLFASNFFAAAAAALYSELCARAFKAPSVVFSIPCLIPLVPGSLLYYTVSHMLSGTYADSIANFIKTMLVALGIAGGLIVVSVIFSVYYHAQKRRLARHQAHAGRETNQ